MTDTLSLTAAHSADRRHSVSVSPAPPYHAPVRNVAPFVEAPIEDDDGEIACICAYTDDDGNTIQCDKCLRWQHIQCYYPPPTEVPGEDQKHYCLDCVHRDDLDARQATDRQRRGIENRKELNGLRRPPAKSHKKKVKGSPSLTAQPNGWPTERHNHIHDHDRKSASPRDQPPPAKRPKTAHRPSGSVGQPRKRTSTINMQRSSSKSPETEARIVIPQYSDDFIHLFHSESPQVDTDTNLMNNIAVTNLLSEWLKDSNAVGKSTGGLTPSDIFKRWDGRMEEIPGRPEVNVQWVEDPRFTQDNMTPRWAQLAVEQDIAPGTLIGELRGRIGQKDDYINDPDGNWNELRHPEPFVFFHPQLPIVIDARQEGSLFRYVRRSCQPNAELQTIITESTEYHFCFMATKDIKAGDEVTVAWQIPDTIRDKISSSLARANNFESKVKDYISRWVSKVLANCGPCACTGQVNCLMAHYDCRGKSLPPEPAPEPESAPAKKARKRKIPHLETAVTSRSRSVSEAPKLDLEEDGIDSRSVSGSRGSASRDITPSTHYSGTTIPPELSEREKKKLMREEEMFRRQEEEYGRQKKKRVSGGSNLNTPSAATSVRSTPEENDKKSVANRFKQKQLGLPPNTKYADAGTSSSRSGQPSVRPLSGKRKAGPAFKTARKDSTVVRAPRSDYVDASTQCDLDQKVEKEAPRPRRRYVSVTQRLLQRCMSNTFKQKTPTLPALPALPALPVLPKEDVDLADHVVTVPATKSVDQKIDDSLADSMDVDKPETHDAHTVHLLEHNPEPESIAEEEPPRVEDAKPEPPVEQSESKQDMDTEMTEVELEPTESERIEPEPLVKVDTESAPTETHVEPPTEPTSSPLDSETAAPLSQSSTDPPPSWLPTSSPEKPESSPIAAQHPHSHKPNMHVDMPPPSTNPFSHQPSLTTEVSDPTLVQSPSALSPNIQAGLSVNPPLFSPTVMSAVNPSPIRKKLSLSDYTKRSKARESLGEPSMAAGADAVDKDMGDNTESANTPVDEMSTADKVAEVVAKAKEAAAADADKPSTENHMLGPSIAEENESAVVDEVTPTPPVSAPIAPMVASAPMKDDVPAPSLATTQPIMADVAKSEVAADITKPASEATLP